VSEKNMMLISLLVFGVIVFVVTTSLMIYLIRYRQNEKKRQTDEMKRAIEKPCKP
jgi:heme/copper-type cytochrome/quinol oxidase subunit 2